jgi:hypothetical protein
MLSNILIWTLLIGFISIILNVVLFLYARRVLLRVFGASEIASEIFTRLDAYQEHLNSVYELPTFYGDETLKSLLSHSRSLIEYLSQYEEIYSFTQPDLLEQLDAASEELQKKYDQEEQAQEKK